MVHPIVDQYYARSPHHRRSTAYVHTKGFSANEKDLSRSPTPLTVPPSLPSLSALPQLHDHRQQSFLRPTIPTFGSSVSRSRTPDASRSRSPLSVTQSEPVESSTAAAASQLQPPSISDIREITPPPGQAARSGQQQSQPVQGNIKKKRASLSAIEGTTFGGAGPLGGLLIDMPEPVREYTNGNPNKIAQLFPELALR